MQPEAPSLRVRGPLSTRVGVPLAPAVRCATLSGPKAKLQHGQYPQPSATPNRTSTLSRLSYRERLLDVIPAVFHKFIPEAAKHFFKWDAKRWRDKQPPAFKVRALPPPAVPLTLPKRWYPHTCTPAPVPTPDLHVDNPRKWPRQCTTPSPRASSRARRSCWSWTVWIGMMR